MEIHSLFRIQKKLSEQVKIEVQKLQENFSKLNQNNPDLESDLKMILDWFHEGINIDQVQFIREVFFEFQISLQKIAPHKERLFREMSRLNEYEVGSVDEAIFLVNVYRNVVSDLFDPYTSILSACFQFKEGSFVNFLYSNLGQGERNKYEFCTARIGSTEILEGYNPVVRNAISHTGTDGITYGKGDILFRNIKRGSDPKVETINWTNEQLQLQILKLIRTIRTIDLAVEIFGIDILQIVRSHKELSRKFLDEIITINDRLELQAPFDRMIAKITSNEELLDNEKLDALSKIFFLECHKRDLKVDRIAFNTEKQMAVIEVPLY